jgi:hypothetical protein
MQELRMKGRKVCPHCQSINGPRSFNCKECGKGFVVKGVQQPDILPEVQLAEAPIANPSKRQKLLNYVREYNGQDDLDRKLKYQIVGGTWISKCGTYKIQEQAWFLGVNMREHFINTFYLLKLIDDTWQRVTPKGRCKTLTSAIKRMLLDMNGVKPKATTKKEKNEVLVSERLNKKHKLRTTKRKGYDRPTKATK